MSFTFNHFNFNVLDLDRSVAFYQEALGLKTVRRREGRGFTLAFMSDEAGSPFTLELTYLHDRKEPYDLGEQEFHLAFTVDDFQAARARHGAMGCIAMDNAEIGIYFIQDPDGYWIEIVPKK